MSILEDIRFERSLPRENREQILAKVDQFIQAWESNASPNDLNTQFSMKKVRGDTILKEVWKFKVSDGCRILFTKAKDLNIAIEGYEDALILLRYCNHDEQITKARQISKVMPKVEDSEELAEQIDLEADLEADKVAEAIDYNPETSITRVFKHMRIESLMDLESLQGIYYLNRNQRECVNNDYRPLILFGSAGSGKTTIGVYKLVDLIRQNPHIKVGYYTYSNRLKETAEKIFETVLKNELEPDEVEAYKKQVEFLSLRDWLKAQTSVDYIVQYDQFNEEFFVPLRQNWSMNPEYKNVILNLTAYEAWREIRGLIKGYAGDNWKPQLEVYGLLSEKEYMRLSRQYGFYTPEQSKVIYALALKYITWQKEKGLLDENDLCKKLFLQEQDIYMSSDYRAETNTAYEEKYDWIVVDEVQDLTELEIYLLQTRVSEAGNFLLSGDYHQTIAPTYFDTKRIMTLLEYYNYRYEEDKNRFVLTYNYRNPKQIVELANQLAAIRKQIFGRDKRNDYSEEVARCEQIGNLYTLCQSRQEKIKLLKTAVEKAYVYIVVATLREKEELEQQLNNKIRIFTIYEVKGLENKYIIGVNLISSLKKHWEKLYKAYGQGRETGNIRLDHPYFYRYMLNLLYVTLTRSQESLCFIEDEVTADFMTKLLNIEMQHETTFDEGTFDLSEVSSAEDFYIEALKFEVAEDYKRALAQYERLRMPKARFREHFCKGKLAEETGRFQEAAQHYEKAKEWQAAAKAYYKAKSYTKYYECFIKWDDKRFMKEVIYNNAIDYNQKIKPYLTPYLKEKITVLCMQYYIDKLPEYHEEQENQILWAEEISIQVEKVVAALEAKKYG
ncbi:UvrD-helicase domain-containing protein [Cellulosilyticum ruminicola]|uniref:UvrD-helicase domain-containing protein n=1 Tax=Cellulosilyticum ruminicola TaxID=425254 RepID=UPI0006D06A52|nr:UvrD-helicase domain-containing protein [Cellulosilyticum ruminicola]